MSLSFTEPDVATTGVLRSAQRLLNRKGRQAAGRFLAEGAQSVREALGVEGLVERVLVVDPEFDLARLNLPYQILEYPQADSIELYTLTREQLARLSDTVTPQGIVAVCRQLSWQRSDVVDPKLVVICAQVRDPGNAGTVIRCADAFGADAVLISADSVELHNPKTIRASVGSVFHLPVITGLSLAEAVEWCKEQGLQVLAADGGGELLTDLGPDLGRPTAWLMGNEAWGLPAEDLALADRVVGVPMWGQAESLNLSTAAAVCLYASASAARQT